VFEQREGDSAARVGDRAAGLRDQRQPLLRVGDGLGALAAGEQATGDEIAGTNLIAGGLVLPTNEPEQDALAAEQAGKLPLGRLDLDSLPDG
jgi:hypothetical protein